MEHNDRVTVKKTAFQNIHQNFRIDYQSLYSTVVFKNARQLTKLLEKSNNKITAAKIHIFQNSPIEIIYFILVAHSI